MRKQKLDNRGQKSEFKKSFIERLFEDPLNANIGWSVLGLTALYFVGRFLAFKFFHV